MRDANLSERKAIRREMRERRRELSATARHEAARSLAANLFSLPRIRHARNLAVYLPVQGEISLELAIVRAWALHIPVYLPRLRGQQLEFRRYQPDTALENNKFGIPEPMDTGSRQNPRFLDVVLTPLLAFDESGERLGTGGGYYDRTFAFLRHRRHWHRPSLIGVAYDFQRVRALPVAAWDVPMQGIITDATRYRT